MSLSESFYICFYIGCNSVSSVIETTKVMKKKRIIYWVEGPPPFPKKRYFSITILR